jgi:hypothetical protein
LLEANVQTPEKNERLNIKNERLRKEEQCFAK